MSARIMPASAVDALGGEHNKNENSASSDAAAASGTAAKRTSNTEEDAVHQRAMMILQMANSVETSNVRRRRRLQQIESGKTTQVQQTIEDIMEEQPLDIMTLLKETNPEALPSTQELKERYGGNDSSDDEEQTTMDGQTTVDGSESTKQVKEAETKEAQTTATPQKKDKIESTAAQDPVLGASHHVPSQDIHPTHESHSEPLQEQLKRSYAAIVKLRENSDLRYQALEKKYLELKRHQVVHGVTAGNSNTGASGTAATGDPSGPSASSEQLKLAFEAIVRLRENSDLRYGVLESKYLDLKRVKAEADSRNERLESELEAMRKELEAAKKMNSGNSSNAMDGGSNHNNKNGQLGNFLLNNSQHQLNAVNGSIAGSMASSLKDNMLPATSARGRRNYKDIKQQAAKTQHKILFDFQGLCQKVAVCNTCVMHVPTDTLVKVRSQLAKKNTSGTMDMSYSGRTSLSRSSRKDETDTSDDADSEPDSADDIKNRSHNNAAVNATNLSGSSGHKKTNLSGSSGHKKKDKAKEFASESDSESSDSVEESMDLSSKSAGRHAGAMALLGPTLNKLEKIEESRKKPGGRFANLQSESKSEKKLRGKKSQFVAAQSGVYCRIDHNMKDQYGDLDKFRAPERPPPPPPAPDSAHRRRKPTRLSSTSRDEREKEKQPQKQRQKKRSSQNSPPPLSAFKPGQEPVEASAAMSGKAPIQDARPKMAASMPASDDIQYSGYLVKDGSNNNNLQDGASPTTTLVTDQSYLGIQAPPPPNNTSYHIRENQQQHVGQGQPGNVSSHSRFATSHSRDVPLSSHSRVATSHSRGLPYLGEAQAPPGHVSSHSRVATSHSRDVQTSREGPPQNIGVSSPQDATGNLTPPGSAPRQNPPKPQIIFEGLPQAMGPRPVSHAPPVGVLEIDHVSVVSGLTMKTRPMVRRIPPAELDPQEREAARRQAARDAKAAASKNSGQDGIQPKTMNDGSKNSLHSKHSKHSKAASAASTDTPVSPEPVRAPPQKRASFLKMFKKKSKSRDPPAPAPAPPVKIMTTKQAQPEKAVKPAHLGQSARRSPRMERQPSVDC